MRFVQLKLITFARVRNASLKIASVLLCGLLIYNSLGYFIVLSVMRISVRHQKWAQLSIIPDHQLTTFVLDKSNPNSRLKILNKREIQVDGKLYDVAKKVDNGTTITFRCIYDAKEEKLIAKTRLFHSLSQPVPAKNTARLIIDKIIKTAVIAQEINNINLDYLQIRTYYTSLTYSEPVIDKLSPPPQTAG